MTVVSVVMVASSCGAEDRVDRRDAVVGIAAEACGQPIRGVGVVLGGNRVLTNAHVVAGADEVAVDAQGGVIVGFDSNRDLALIEVADLDRPAVELAGADADDRGTLYVVEPVEGTVEHRYRIKRRIRATGEDIYRVDGADRQALEVEVEFRPGWSGAGLFDRAGRLVGVAFAESRTQPDVAYAVASDEIAGFVASAGSTAVDVGPCL